MTLLEPYPLALLVSAVFLSAAIIPSLFTQPFSTESAIKKGTAHAVMPFT
nr:hypothetical protein [Thaumasiovibrio occultus]